MGESIIRPYDLEVLLKAERARISRLEANLRAATGEATYLREALLETSGDRDEAVALLEQARLNYNHDVDTPPYDKDEWVATLKRHELVRIREEEAADAAE